MSVSTASVRPALDRISVGDLRLRGDVVVDLPVPDFEPTDPDADDWYLTVASFTSVTRHPVDGTPLSVIVEWSQASDRYLLWVPLPHPVRTDTALLIPGYMAAAYSMSFVDAASQAVDAVRLLARLSHTLNPHLSVEEALRIVVHGSVTDREILLSRDDLADEVHVALALRGDDRQKSNLAARSAYHRLVGKAHPQSRH